MPYILRGLLPGACGCRLNFCSRKNRSNIPQGAANAKRCGCTPLSLDFCSSSGFGVPRRIARRFDKPSSHLVKLGQILRNGLPLDDRTRCGIPPEPALSEQRRRQASCAGCHSLQSLCGPRSHMNLVFTGAWRRRTPTAVYSATRTSAMFYDGRKLFEKSCSGCRGKKLEGISGPALWGAAWKQRFAGAGGKLRVRWLNMPASPFNTAVARYPRLSATAEWARSRQPAAGRYPHTFSHTSMKRQAFRGVLPGALLPSVASDSGAP